MFPLMLDFTKQTIKLLETEASVNIFTANSNESMLICALKK